MLLPLDPLLDSLPPTLCHLKVVSSTKYLGITISAAPYVFISDNIDPLLHRLQIQSKTWNKLSLLVVSQINLFNMIWMPQLLYRLHNAPIWIHLQIITVINSIFRYLIWWNKTPRIKLEALQYPENIGELTVPNPRIYFRATQLKHFAGWDSKRLSCLFSHAFSDRPPLYVLEGAVGGHFNYCYAYFGANV